MCFCSIKHIIKHLKHLIIIVFKKQNKVNINYPRKKRSKKSVKKAQKSILPILLQPINRKMNKSAKKGNNYNKGEGAKWKKRKNEHITQRVISK